MDKVLGLLSIFDVSSRSGGLFGSSGVSSGSISILIILAVVGASYINGMTGRTRYLDSAVSVSGMLIGAFLANALAGHVRLPIDSEVLVAAIVGLGGMPVTGLMLLFAYRRSEY